MHHNKPELREEMRRLRACLDGDEYRTWSQAIAQKLREVRNWAEVTSVHCFNPFVELKEPDIHAFTDYLQAAGKALFYPQKVANGWQMQPASATPFDVVVVPMLAFDDAYYRLGYGGGYYDTFLASQPQTCKIGVCFELGHVPVLPHEDHDIPLDIIVTEQRVLKREATAK